MTNVFGVTSFNDGLGEGTVYNVSLGLTLFIKPLLAYGAVGTAVDILGTDLAGATSVTFNGTATTFIIVSASSLKATCTLPSNTRFRVLQ